jgi:hypothetical protein
MNRKILTASGVSLDIIKQEFGYNLIQLYRIEEEQLAIIINELMK